MKNKSITRTRTLTRTHIVFDGEHAFKMIRTKDKDTYKVKQNMSRTGCHDTSCFSGFSSRFRNLTDKVFKTQ